MIGIGESFDPRIVLVTGNSRVSPDTSLHPRCVLPRTPQEGRGREGRDSSADLVDPRHHSRLRSAARDPGLPIMTDFIASLLHRFVMPYRTICRAMHHNLCSAANDATSCAISTGESS
jgi:hypothetical protein